MILRLDRSGLPLSWVTPLGAAHFMAKDHVAWSLGDEASVIHGGTNSAGVRSELSIPSIIATRGNGGHRNLDKTPFLNNKALFSRDDYMCLYCGKNRDTGGRKFKLTRDHVDPRGQGGLDVWSNVVAACSRCNNAKGCQTPAQAGMKLLAVPYTPNFSESLILSNRKILTDQMDFLRSFCKHDKFL